MGNVSTATVSASATKLPDSIRAAYADFYRWHEKSRARKLVTPEDWAAVSAEGVELQHKHGNTEFVYHLFEAAIFELELANKPEVYDNADC